MSLPANLFVDTPEMEDASLHQLSNDVDSWPEEIVQKVKERIPSSAGLNMMVKFMKKDEETGVATGSVTVHSPNEAIVIPLIIKDFMMYPLDVMIAKKKLLPLNQDYFDAVMNKNDVFAKVEEYPMFGGLGRFEDANLWNAIYPPSLGRYAYASAGYDILDSISDTIDGREFKAWLKQPGNEKVAARLLFGPHKEVVQKVANLQPVNMNEYRQGVENLIPRSIVMLRYDGPNKYSILSNSDKLFHPAILSGLTRNECERHLSKLCDNVADDINDVDQNGEKLLMLPEGKNEVILAKEDMEIPEEAREYDHFSVKNKNGVNVEGVVIPKVIDFDMKLTGLRLFVGKTESTYQNNIYGVRIKNSRFKPQTCKIPCVGQTGCFIYQPDNSNALATVPVTVTAVVDDVGNTIVKAVDLTGAPLRLKLTDEMSFDMQRIALMGPRSYMIPGRMRWLPLEGFQEVSNSPEDYSIKQASERLTTHPVTVIGTGYDMYAMRGVSKYASVLGWDASCLKSSEAKFLLASLGCGKEKIAHIIKKASTHGSAEVHGLDFKPLANEKIAEARPLAEHLYARALELRSNLIKEASYLENSQTVDALLSLNFVTPTNISKFVSKIPQLKSAVSTLASCLIASRLGIKEIPELSTSNAMSRLVEVIDGLEKLRAVQTVGV